MDSGLPEFLDVEYRRIKRLTRIVLILAMVCPASIYGPLIWKDGSYTGRWIFASDIEIRPLACRGMAYFLQICEVKFLERPKNQIVKLDYMVFGTDWSEMTTDIVRSDDTRLTAAIGVTGPGLLARVCAFAFLLGIGLGIERIIWRFKFRSLKNRVFDLSPAPRKRDAVMLSRDRRDHY